MFYNNNGRDLARECANRRLLMSEIFSTEISMIFDISEFPESKYTFFRKFVCVSACVGVCVYLFVGRQQSSHFTKADFYIYGSYEIDYEGNDRQPPHRP